MWHLCSQRSWGGVAAKNGGNAIGNIFVLGEWAEAESLMGTISGDRTKTDHPRVAVSLGGGNLARSLQNMAPTPIEDMRWHRATL